MFLPVYLFVIVPGRLLRRHGEQPRLQGFIKGTTAASIAIALAALAVLLQRRVKVPEPALVAIAGAIGVLALR